MTDTPPSDLTEPASADTELDRAVEAAAAGLTLAAGELAEIGLASEAGNDACEDTVLRIGAAWVAQRRSGEQELPHTDAASAAASYARRLDATLSRATAALGDAERARRWLLRAPGPRALDGLPPAALLTTDEGTARVLATLGRIEHGVLD